MTIVEWIIAAILILICFNTSVFSYGGFSPIGAHESSERTYRYGPSDIIKTIELDNVKIYLCKYKNWYSTSIVQKEKFKWYTRGIDVSKPIDTSLPINYTWDYTNVNHSLGVNKVFGYVANPDITAVLVESENHEHVLKYELDNSRMFIFTWNGENELYRFKNIKGFDAVGNVVYEKALF